jgi:hypothetical protein
MWRSRRGRLVTSCGAVGGHAGRGGVESETQDFPLALSPSFGRPSPLHP